MEVTPDMVKNGWIYAVRVLAEGAMTGEQLEEFVGILDAMLAVTVLPDPATATAPQIAAKLNEVILAMTGNA